LPISALVVGSFDEFPVFEARSGAWEHGVNFELSVVGFVNIP
jgi:hypothetical protein